ncbi:MAG: hypothetical protein JWM11_1105 [Planctomycetaceae bacterium]|nr:hypothetical protein [Planctomycetaceae bacterium]
MKRLTAALLLASLSLMSLPGCSDTASVKQENKTTTPGGYTTTTVEKEVKTTGKNPPPANP